MSESTNAADTAATQPGRKKRGGQPGNTNALKHGFYTKNFSLAERRGLEATKEIVLADEIVFGSNTINFQGWNYGITDLVTEIAESDSRMIEPTDEDCRKLKKEIQKFQPKVAILLHGKVTKTFLPYLGKNPVRANYGQIGKIINNCPTMFYSIAFPHGNNIPSREKVDNYIKVKKYLLMLEYEQN